MGGRYFHWNTLSIFVQLRRGIIISKMNRMTSDKSYLSTFYRLYLPISIILASLVYVMQKSNAPLHPLINNYLNDFLCMPIVLFISQYVVRRLRSDAHFQISLPLILMVTFGYATYFEYYLPGSNVRYTGDFVDVFLYFSGAIFFYLLERKRVNANTTKHTSRL